MKKAGLLLFIVALAAGGYLWYDYHSQPAEEWRELSQEDRLVSIVQGSSLQDISRQLEDKGAIRSRHLFRVYAMITDQQAGLQAGTYRFGPEEDMTSIMRRISRGDVAQMAITIPEGFTFEEIARRLSSRLNVETGEVLKSAEKKSWDRDYLPDSENVQWQLEGYLYPDTYSIPYDIEPEELLSLMLDRFEERWREELEDADTDLDVNELVTLASLVEKEGKLSEEKPLIAGVIYNRLESDMKLQIDASVQYALEERQARLLYRDLEVDSTYNTYLYEGLPPGPIASPGDNSLRAALSPEDSDYLFYFARSDGSHIFTETYQEHLEQQRIIDQ